MAGRAMLAIAVSSEASASAVKIAATAQRRSSGGRPSMPGVAGGFAVVTSDILIGLSTPGGVPTAACTTDARHATGTPLHDAYAKGATGRPKMKGSWQCSLELPASAAYWAADFLLLPARGAID